AVLEATFLPRSYHILFEAIRGISVERSEMGERLLILEELLRDLLVLKAATGASLVHEDIRERLIRLAERTTERRLEELYDNLLQSREGILKINANVGISMQALFLPARAQSEEKRDTR